MLAVIVAEKTARRHGVASPRETQRADITANLDAARGASPALATAGVTTSTVPICHQRLVKGSETETCSDRR